MNLKVERLEEYIVDDCGFMCITELELVERERGSDTIISYLSSVVSRNPI